MVDLLGNQPAWPDTPVPGRWVLDLHHSPASLHVRVFELPLEGDGNGPESSLDAQRRNSRAASRVRPLHVAWRAVNSLHANEVDQGMRGVLQTPTAIIIPRQERQVKQEHDAHGSPRDDSSVLWLFEIRGPNASQSDQFHQLALESLQEKQSESRSFPLSELLSCPLHATSTGCLRGGANASTCDVRFRPGKRAQVWDLFTRSVVEKMSWRSGKRVHMDRSSSPLAADLRPLANERLLLTVRPAAEQVPRRITLQPLGMVAYHVASHTPTVEQETRLDAAFTDALGPSWRSTRAAWVTSRQLANMPTPMWGIYWVSTPTFTGSHPRSEDARGVMTVWPNHLTSLHTPRPPKRKRRIRPTEAVKINDRLADASALFDFFSTYKEAPTPIPVPEEISDSPDPGFDKFATPIPDVTDTISNGATGTNRARSDIDDLFSSRSASPEPVEPVEPVVVLPDVQLSGPSQGVNGATDSLNNRRIGIDGDIVMTGDSPPRISSRASYFGDDGMGAITEHDFDFFDDPGAVGDQVAAEPLIVQATEDRIENTANDAVETPRPSVKVALVEAVEEKVPVVQADPAPMPLQNPEVDGPAETIIPNGQVTEQPVTDKLNTPILPADSHPTPLLASSEGSPVRAQVVRFDGLPSPASTVNNDPPRDEFIPSAFAPLPIPSRHTHKPPPTFPPSPAPSPESLRLGLLERLRGPKKNTKFDYSAAWTMDETPSESEADYDDSRAPPTPESIDGWVDDFDAESPSAEVESKGGDVEYDGIPCIGAEWTWIAATRTALEGVPWKPSWGALPLDVAKARKKVDGKRSNAAMLQRLACEVVANRHFRVAVKSPSPSPPLSDLLSSEGVTLSNLLEADNSQDHFIRPTPSCNVHAGFGGNVMRLAITGTLFWKELGLSPAGGEKDCEYVILSGKSREASRTVQLLHGLSEVWEGLKLGQHVFSDIKAPDVQEGLAKALASIAASGSTAQIIIYVVGPSEMLATSLLDDLGAATVPASCTIHLVPTSLQQNQLVHLAFDVYNRISRPVHKVQSGESSAQSVRYQYPTFTIAPDETVKPSISMSWPLQSYDVLNRWRLIHAAYTTDIATGTITAFVIDSEGENWRVQTYSNSDMAQVQESIWSLCAEFAASAAIEWHLVLTRLGSPLIGEMERWASIVKSSIPLTVLVAESGSRNEQIVLPPLVPANLSANIMSDKTTRVTNDTLSYTIGRFGHRIPLQVMARDQVSLAEEAVYPLLSWFTSVSTAAAPGDGVSTLYHVCFHRGVAGRSDRIENEVLEREFQRLVYLARTRFGFGTAGLPIHLEAVRACTEAFGECL